MRVFLVGPPSDRARLRPQLERDGLEVAGEFTSLAVAQRSLTPVDAIVVTPSPTIDRNDGTDEEAEGLVEPLTPREREVLELLAEGLPNKSIARRLGISDQTVKFHVASIGGKLGASNRTETVRRAVRRGLITL